MNNEEEREFDHMTDEPLAAKVALRDANETTKQSTQDFLKQDKEDLAVAKAFLLQYRKGEDDTFVWDILADDDHVTDLPIPSTDTEISLKMPEDDSDFDFNKTLFESFFASIVGHAKLLDEYHANTRLSMYTTVCRDTRARPCTRQFAMTHSLIYIHDSSPRVSIAALQTAAHKTSGRWNGICQWKQICISLKTYLQKKNESPVHKFAWT